jgi:hypothetical protein
LADILKLVDEMEQDSRAIKKELIKMCWFMRGGITIEQIYQMDVEERNMIGDLIKENLETTKETKLPFF